MRYTDRTVVDADELGSLFETVRREGFSRSIRQFNQAQGAVAAPVFDVKGQVSKAVCVLAFSSQLDETNVAHVGASVRACAARITERMSGSAGGEHDTRVS